MQKTAAQLNLDMNTVIAWLVSHGIPQSVADKVKVIEGHAKEIVWMVLTDTAANVEAFINSEYQKVVAALQATVTP